MLEPLIGGHRPGVASFCSVYWEQFKSGLKTGTFTSREMVLVFVVFGISKLFGTLSI
jgi:hypothetical protein